MTEVHYLDVADVLVIAEFVLDIDAHVLAKASRVELIESALGAPQAAFGGIEFVEDIRDKVAVLGYRIMKNHGLIDGNKRVALQSMIEFAERNGLSWRYPKSQSDEDEVVSVMFAAAGGEISEAAFIAWVRTRVVNED